MYLHRTHVPTPNLFPTGASTRATKKNKNRLGSGFSHCGGRPRRRPSPTLKLRMLTGKQSKTGELKVNGANGRRNTSGAVGFGGWGLGVVDVRVFFRPWPRSAMALLHEEDSFVKDKPPKSDRPPRTQATGREISSRLTSPVGWSTRNSGEGGSFSQPPNKRDLVLPTLVHATRTRIYLASSFVFYQCGDTSRGPATFETHPTYAGLDCGGARLSGAHARSKPRFWYTLNGKHCCICPNSRRRL